MKVYTTDKIRNVAILGHGGAGKTTLVEAMAYLTGIVSRMGKVDDGSSLSDFDKEEQKRGFSISSTVIPLEYGGCKINIIDTPGYFDFVGEVEEGVAAADAAVIVVSGKSGIEVGTEKAWDICEKNSIPRMFFITDMDAENANFDEVLSALESRFGTGIAPFDMPMKENDKVVGFINIVDNSGHKFLDGGKIADCDVPDSCADDLETYRGTLLEAVAETSEELMEKYFEGEELTVDEIRTALKGSIAEGDIVPVAMGSGLGVLNVESVLKDIINYFPSPAGKSCVGKNNKNDEEFAADFDDSKAKSAYVFKTIVDPFIGKYSLFKVCSGVFKPTDPYYNSNKENEEKPGKLYIMQGNKPIEIPELHAGDIGAMAKLNSTDTGDTLATKDTPIIFEKTEVSQPYTYKRYECRNKGDEDKVSQALSKLCQEDLTLKVVLDSQNRQSLLYGIGDQQLDVVVSKLASRYKVDVDLSEPKIAFKETIRKPSDIDEKYKKQSGGHGQYGHVKIKFEPSGDLETPYIFEECVVGGSVPKNYFPAVEKGLQDSVVKGPVAGYPVVGVKATLYDGSYHPVDSSEMAFKTATIQAFKKGVLAGNPVLLEPIESVKVTVPDTYTGDVMGDLNKRRGRVLGMNPVRSGWQVVEAEVPMMGMFGYCTDLRSMTGGRGTFEYEFIRYEQAPSDVQEKEIAARAEEDK